MFWENQVYGKGRQLNKYPFDAVVSNVLRNIHKLPKPLSALDIGSGSGNHLKFFAENGFRAVGIEQSKTAVDFSIDFLRSSNRHTEVIHDDIMNMSSHLAGEEFSFILDRGSLTHNPLNNVANALGQIANVLHPQGMFLSYIFSDSHSSLRSAKVISENYYASYLTGDFAECPAPALFLDKTKLLSLFTRHFRIVTLSKLTNTDCLSSDCSEMFECLCVRG